MLQYRAGNKCTNVSAVQTEETDPSEEVLDLNCMQTEPHGPQHMHVLRHINRAALTED